MGPLPAANGRSVQVPSRAPFTAPGDSMATDSFDPDDDSETTLSFEANVRAFTDVYAAIRCAEIQADRGSMKTRLKALGDEFQETIIENSNCEVV